LVCKIQIYEVSAVPKIENSPVIEGVQLVKFDLFGDERGCFRESFRRDWFPQRSWENLQSNLSESKAGVLRGLHYHFQQVDYWFVAAGTIRAGLVDLRAGSSTYGAVQTIDMGGDNQLGLFIPVGVAHGFAAHTDVTFVYIVDQYFNGSDEYGVAWNDPALGIDWGVEAPLVSRRDMINPLMKDILPEHRPR
jgi:dTDP-4-dehydrorhamnose 3,5-epimerase